jgi:DUF4097 and DUF4098 domain-containing protein YvlB
MRKRLLLGAALGTLLGTLLTGPMAAQDSADRITVPFRNASQPRKLTVNLINGSVTVKGYDGKDAIVESSSRVSSRSRRPSSVPEGMHRIGPNTGGVDIEEDNNSIKVVGGIMHSADLMIQVPVQTSLVLRTVNGGKISVENISGEIDVNNTNGSIVITNASGSVLANSNNGKVMVSLDRVTPGKAMSFSALNGNIDVTFPGDIKANLRMKTNNGEIWSDFDVKLDASKTPVVEDNRGKNGKYKVRLDHAVYGSINGGGPEIQFVSFNGNIVIHKK